MAIYSTSTTTGTELFWIESPTLDSSTIVHGMFTRKGGVSQSNHCSLNVSFGVQDIPAHVKINRGKIRNVLQLPRIVSIRQIHSDKVLILGETPDNKETTGYDAIITNQPGIGLMIQQADCQAVLMHDPVKQVIAAVHSGWRGSVENIIEKTIRKLETQFHIQTHNLRAVISPSIGPCCAEFIHYREELPKELWPFQRETNHFDFWKISGMQLKQCGVREDNIGTAQICTVCNTDFFSHRRSQKTGKHYTGRSCSVIALKPPL